MKDALETFFGDKMPPHGHCYLWDDRLVSLHVVSDLLIVLSYFTIPLALMYLVKKREDLKFNYMFVLFAVFIFACGTTHLVNIYNVWYGAYWLSGSIKAITALASVGTAILVWPLIPKALAIPGTGELTLLNVQLRAEADRNAAQAQELEQLSEALEEQVRERTSELEHAKLMLEVNNRALEESNRELAQYAKLVSHDLREPLKKVQSQAFLADSRLRRDGDPVVRRSVGDILQTSKHMMALVESLLSYAHIESINEPPVAVDANEVLEEAVRDLSVPIRQQGVSLISNPLPPIRMQRYHLHQVLLNLLSNAIHYGRGSRQHIIEVGPLLLPGESLVGFHVKDNGKGIAENDQHRIFDFVERGSQGGSGIGLAICRKIVEQYGGRIEVDSRPGEGANFKVYLPRGK